MKEITQRELLLYQDEKGSTQIEVRLENENVWLTQAQLVTLYQSSKANVSEHIKHIFEEGELEERGCPKSLIHEERFANNPYKRI